MSKKEPLVSVIVPIYNVEKYVRECLESILNQSYRNIEVLMINDGSTDGSSKICKEYEERDKRFKLYNKKNGGLSDARNYGLDRIKGEYVCFVDGDDIITTHFIMRLCNSLLSTGKKCSFSCCRYKRFSHHEKNGSEDCKDCNDVILDSRAYLIKTLYQKDHTLYTVSVCTKMFRGDFLKRIRFPVGVLYEDLAIVDETVGEANAIIVCDAPLYLYRSTPDSITKGGFESRKVILIDHCSFLVNKYSSDKQLRRAANAMLFARTFELLLLFTYSGEKDKAVLNQMWGTIKKIRVGVLFDRSVRLFVRFVALVSFSGRKISLNILSFIKYRCIL